MRAFSIDTKDGIFEGVIKLVVPDTKHLDTLMHQLEAVDGVYQVYRVG
jgi:GTP diphosphokinase / guanosine-3',5'-bis(diphosphate) 3'-diphosphatase